MPASLEVMKETQQQINMDVYQRLTKVETKLDLLTFGIGATFVAALSALVSILLHL